MKKHLRIVIAAVLVLACVGALLAFAACDEEKQQATIEAENRQEFDGDGQVHNVVAKLNHDETELVYSPQQGYSEIGEYTITITAAETENYYAPEPVTVKLIILDPSDVAREELTDKLASSTVFKTSENIGVDLGVDLAYDPKGEAEGWGYKLAVKGSLDLAAPDSTLFSISLTDTLKKEEVFGIVYDGAGDDIYIAYGDVKYKAENADLLEALVSEAPNADVTLGSYLSMIVGTLGADGECTVSEDGKTYTLDFDLKAMLKGTLGNILGGLLEGEDFAGIASAIYKLVGASDWNGFIEKLPEISGDIVVSFDDNDDLVSLSLAFLCDRTAAGVLPVPVGGLSATAASLVSVATLGGGTAIARGKEFYIHAATLPVKAVTVARAAPIAALVRSGLCSALSAAALAAAGLTSFSVAVSCFASSFAVSAASGMLACRAELVALARSGSGDGAGEGVYALSTLIFCALTVGGGGASAFLAVMGMSVPKPFAVSTIIALIVFLVSLPVAFVGLGKAARRAVWGAVSGGERAIGRDNGAVSARKVFSNARAGR